jgi:hypothetical protein
LYYTIFYWYFFNKTQFRVAKNATKEVLRLIELQKIQNKMGRVAENPKKSVS